MRLKNKSYFNAKLHRKTKSFEEKANQLLIFHLCLLFLHGHNFFEWQIM